MGNKSAGTSRRRRRIRVFILVIFVVVPVVVGWHFRPQAQKAPAVIGPSIVVLASKANLAATVNATLSIGYRHGPDSKLQLTLLSTNKISGTVQLAVELNDFPSGTTVAGADVVPVTPPPASSAGSLPVAAVPYPPGYRDYAFPLTLTEPPGSAPAMQKITINAPTAIGAASRGDQLRVALPVLRGEGPGANVSVAYKIGDLFGGAASLLGSRQGYPMALQAGTSTFSDTSHSLSGYQILAGDPPTLLGDSSWAWNGINDATVLATDVHAENVDQLKVFYSGLALGLAFAAFITLLLELIPAESEASSGEGQASATEEDSGGRDSADDAPANDPV